MNISVVIEESLKNQSSSVTTEDQHYDSFTQDLSILILYTFTFVLGLFGNSLVCFVVFSRKITTTTYVLIGNLAFSDILGSIAIPSQWLVCSHYMLEEYGDRGCGFMKSLQILSYYISTLTMTVIAFDRFRIVYYPLGTRMKPWLPIALIWIISTVFVSSTLVSMRISEYFTPKRLIYCRIVFPSTISFFSTAPFRKFRATFVMVTQYLIPSIVSVVLYALCLKKLISRKTIGAVTDQQSKDFYRSKRTTIKMLTIALLAFIVAWFPVHTIHMIDFYITPLLAKSCNSSYYYLFFYWLAISTCCFNPFIYCYLNNDFRMAAKKVLLCGINQNWNQSRDRLHSKTSRSSGLSSSTSIFYLNSNFTASINENKQDN